VPTTLPLLILPIVGKLPFPSGPYRLSILFSRAGVPSQCLGAPILSIFVVCDVMTGIGVLGLKRDWRWIRHVKRTDCAQLPARLLHSSRRAHFSLLSTTTACFSPPFTNTQPRNKSKVLAPTRQLKMSDQNGSTTFHKENVDPTNAPSADKGKGKATEPATHDVSMDEEDSSSEDEVDEVSRTPSINNSTCNAH
jgi:hypothetical protein